MTFSAVVNGFALDGESGMLYPFAVWLRARIDGYALAR